MNVQQPFETINTAQDDNWLLYDGECPLCRNYVKLARIRKTVPLKLLDARGHHAILVAEMRSRGFDINQGMILKLNGDIHHGSDAMFVLSHLDSDNKLFQGFMKFFFLNRKRSSFVYPFCVFVRNSVLTLLNKKQI